MWIEDRAEHAEYQTAMDRWRAAKKAGSKRNAPGRWRVRWYDLAGKPKARVFAKLPEAEAKRSEIEDSLRDGSYRDPAAGRVLLRTIAEQWFTAQTGVKRSTRRKYRDHLDNDVLPRWGDLPIAAIDRDGIAAWLAGLQQSKAAGGRGLGSSQVRGIHGVLAMVLGSCVPKRLAVNPAEGVPLPKRPPSDHVYLTYDQVEALAEAAGKLTTKAGHPVVTAGVNPTLIRVLSYTGLRWGEASAVRVGRVHLARRRIEVVTAYAEENGELYEDTPKSNERRAVPIPASLVAEIKALIDGRDADALVFTTDRGAALRLRNWRYREFAAARKAAGLDGIGLTPHKLRHTAASLAIAAGADVYVVQRMLGHSSASMTLDTYGHLFPDRLDEVADAMDERRAAALTKKTIKDRDGPD